MEDPIKKMSEIPSEYSMMPRNRKDQKLLKTMKYLNELDLPTAVQSPSPETLAILREAPLSDAGNAERFLALYHDQYLYAGRDWYQWTGAYWTQIEAMLLYEPITCTVRYARGLYEMQGRDDKEIRQTIHSLLVAENQPRLQAVSRLAAAKVYKPINALDQDPWLLATPNGTINLRDGSLHEPDPKDRITHISAAIYDETADDGLWSSFLKDVFPDKDIRHWIQKFFGYAATGLTSEHKFLILLGEGRNGKSTFINAIAAALGSYCFTMDPAVLLDTRADTDGSKPTPYLAKLRGIRLAVASETRKGRVFNDALIKNITSDDRITARTLHRDPIEFWPTHTLVLMTNYAPEVTDTEDKGMRARMVIVPCDAVPKKIDRDLPEKLRQPETQSAILNWLIRGCKDYQAEGLEPLPTAISQALDRYYGMNDLLSQFIEEECVVQSGKSVLATKFVDFYNDWRRENGCFELKRKTIIESMQRKGYGYSRKHLGWSFEGIGLEYQAMTE